MDKKSVSQKKVKTGYRVKGIKTIRVFSFARVSTDKQRVDSCKKKFPTKSLE